MKPAHFEYLKPITPDELYNQLSFYGEDAKIMAGGQSLVPIMNMRLSTPKYIIDINHIEDFSYIKLDGDHIAIGALTRQTEVENSSIVEKYCPLLQEAIRYVGHAQIRNMGTIGGTIAHADPSAEVPCVLSTLRGEIVVANVEEERVVSPEEFFLTYMLSSLEPTEVIKEIRIPILSKDSGYAFEEIARRDGDFAILEAIAVIDLNENGQVAAAKIGVGGAGPTPEILEDVEDFVVGKELTDNVLDDACEQIKDILEPDSDLHGSAEYRKDLASVLVKRALETALTRAKEGA
ncbi:xanthine dehydrogenase family protein subunit M [Salicibibacter cibarius]|uniref:Xanthine dehydrogenase family protein subunit M n=1 Tax=Salicibibacter cibarius TaxID=2743000 RepID=A0A7T7CAH4_9BACI|nr:xanthine dehydrogenase family protein subunit M [Salicibibacter cibarius]QQK74719.1 xanthine dehydrogenase family protein subunit M [Salicibibacter cibarius]